MTRNNKNDWIALIKKFHKLIPSGYVLYIEPPASSKQIQTAKKVLPSTIPDEFFELYSFCNGCGLDAEESRYWFMVPIEEIGALVKSTERWYAKTHRSLKGRFYPFIDWSNGDTMGYYFSKSGELMPGLYCFEHEEYQHDSDQNVDEFIVRWNSSIFGLLTKGAGKD
ncbi:MAG: SMI1/KNR4 family protein [Planctomycetales bacterium]|nr:SMI1/KNR4 family protein [Planctomycetales bacterium]